MRNPRKKPAKRSRQRRAILAVILMAGSSVVMADGPQRQNLRVLPPLPLKPATAADRVKANPFCEKSSIDQPIQLASGGQTTTIRLKPIGAAIGLQAIENSGPTAIKSPAMIIEPISPAVVRSNPLVGSVHHDNRELVDTEVVDRVSTPAAAGIKPAEGVSTRQTPAPGASTIILVPPMPIAPVVSEPLHSPPVATTPAAEPSFSGQPTEPAMTRQPDTSAAPAESDPAQVVINEESEPIVFSLSDSIQGAADPGAAHAGQDICEPNQDACQLPEVQEIASIATQAMGEPEDLDDVAENDEHPALGPPVRVSQSPAVELGIAEPIVLDAAEAESLEPMDSVIDEQVQAPIAIYRDEPVIPGPVEMPEPSLHTKRYRPPVAVKAVPLALERTPESSRSVEESTIQPVQELNLSGLGLATAGSVQLTPLYLSRAQVRSLTVGGRVQGVKVTDKSVCQAFASGENQLKLIGTGNGVTRLVVWAAANNADATIRMRAFEIHVRDAVEATGSQIGQKAELLNQSIRKAFPNCNVSVRSQRNQLVVAGQCDSETSAKQIIRMVRKTCLVPVQDKLVVR